MTEAKHAGWEVGAPDSLNGCIFLPIVANGETVAEVQPEYFEEKDYFQFTDDTWVKARLIAAAPDLLAVALEAKQLLINELEEPHRTVFWKLVAAISKASLPSVVRKEAR